MALNPWIIIAYVTLLILIGVAFVLFMRMRWKIPVVILRYVGNKQRPTVILAKARFVGVGGLWVKGYPNIIKNFDSKDYYPSLKGHGALVLWEFKQNWLVPTVPKKQLKLLSPDERARVEDGLKVLREKGIVGFEYDAKAYDHMMLSAIDSVDSEYFLRELERQKSQYTGGWKDFITQNGTWMSIVMIGGFMLVGYIVYLDRAPDIAGQCISAGVEAAKNTYLRELAGNLSGGGSIPLG